MNTDKEIRNAVSEAYTYNYNLIEKRCTLWPDDTYTFSNVVNWVCGLIKKEAYELCKARNIDTEKRDFDALLLSEVAESILFDFGDFKAEF